MSVLNTVLIIIATIIISYLFGSISFAVIISNYIAHKDIRNMGSGNAGMTNVMRTLGAKAGIITFLLDSLKGVLACVIAKYIVFDYLYEQTLNAWFCPTYWGYICGIFCLLGHLFPIFFRFRGGKGVATCAGILLACNPMVFVIGISVFLIVFVFSKTISIASLFAVLSVVISTIFLTENTGLPNTDIIQIALVVIMAIIVVIKHKDNINRIKNGEEKPLEIHKED